MKRILYIVAVLSSLALSSCENMFNKMITYNGSPEPASLCLSAEITVDLPAKVYLTRSWFFLDTDRFEGNPNYGIQRRGIVSDATVEMQVNGGEWLPLTYVYAEDYYTRPCTFQAGDKVTIRAQHPDFATVTATETVPAKPTFTPLINAPRESVLPLTFQMDALPLSADQVVFFDVTAYGFRTDTNVIVVYDYYSGSYDEAVDTFVLVDKTPVLCRMLYSEDFMFSEYNLPRTTHNLYGQNGPLYTSGDHFTESKDVTLLLDLAKWTYRDDVYDVAPDTLKLSDLDNPEETLRKGTQQANCFDSIVVNVRVSNASFYMYRTTVAGNRSSSSVPEISWYSDEGSNGFDDIFGEIAEIFSELGNQEGTQIYSNVENGFGHLCFLNQTQRLIYPVKIIIPIETNYYD